MDPYPLFESVSKGIYCSNCMEVHGKEIKESPEETTTVSQHTVLFFYVSGCTECVTVQRKLLRATGSVIKAPLNVHYNSFPETACVQSHVTCFSFYS